MKQRAREGLLENPLNPQSPKRVTWLSQIRREAPVKCTEEKRDTIGGSALHDHDHPVGGDPRQTRDGGAVLESLNPLQYRESNQDNRFVVFTIFTQLKLEYLYVSRDRCPSSRRIVP